MPTPFEVWKAAIDCLPRVDIDAYAELFGDGGVMELPFVPPGVPARFTGREEIRSVLGPLWRRTAATGRRIFGPDRVLAHATGDTDVAIVEFEMRGQAADGEPFRLPYLQVVRARDGRIVHLRDYVDSWAIGQRLEAASADVARRYIEAWNGTDVDLDAILSPRWVDHAHPEVRSISDVGRAIEERRRLALQFTVNRQTVDGDRVALEVNVSGRPHVFVFASSTESSRKCGPIASSQPTCDTIHST